MVCSIFQTYLTVEYFFRISCGPSVHKESLVSISLWPRYIHSSKVFNQHPI